MRKITRFKTDMADSPVVSRRVDPAYLQKLEAIADAVHDAFCISRPRPSSPVGDRMRTLLSELDVLEPRQNRWRTDAEIEERL